MASHQPIPNPTLFGAQAPSPGLFGGTTRGSSTAPSPTTPFGQSSTTTSAIGAPSTSTFGSEGFGGGTDTSFGTTAPAAGRRFGSVPAQSTFGGSTVEASTLTATPFGGGFSFGGSGGTRNVPFLVTSRQEGTNLTTNWLETISSMWQFENKSFEELRFEDYSQGNRGTTSPAPAPSGSDDVEAASASDSPSKRLRENDDTEETSPVGKSSS